MLRVHTPALPSPVHTQATPSHSPPSSLPSPVHTHVRLPLPSFFPPHPCASRLAPVHLHAPPRLALLHLPSQPRPHAPPVPPTRLPSRSPPPMHLHLPSRSPPSSLPSPWRTSRAPSDSVPHGLRRIPSLDHVWRWAQIWPFPVKKGVKRIVGVYIYNIYQLVVFNLQLVSNNIATWLLTTVPGSLEQYRPPPRFVPAVQFPTLRLWHITLLPCRPCLDCLAHVLCRFWTPNPIVSAPQHSSTHHPTHVREAWTSTTPTHASFYLCTAPEQPALMLVVRPCAQRNHVCRVHSAHFGHPRPYLSPATPLHSPPHVPPRSMDQPTHAPPVSLPSIFPPHPSPVPTHAPLSLPSIFPPKHPHYHAHCKNQHSCPTPSRISPLEPFEKTSRRVRVPVGGVRVCVCGPTSFSLSLSLSLSLSRLCLRVGG